MLRFAGTMVTVRRHVKTGEKKLAVKNRAERSFGYLCHFSAQLPSWQLSRYGYTTARRREDGGVGSYGGYDGVVEAKKSNGSVVID
jgi:hypothetical protein